MPRTKVSIEWKWGEEYHERSTTILFYNTREEAKREAAKFKSELRSRGTKVLSTVYTNVGW